MPAFLTVESLTGDGTQRPRLTWLVASLGFGRGVERGANYVSLGSSVLAVPDDCFWASDVKDGQDVKQYAQSVQRLLWH